MPWWRAWRGVWWRAGRRGLGALCGVVIDGGGWVGKLGCASRSVALSCFFLVDLIEPPFSDPSHPILFTHETHTHTHTHTNSGALRYWWHDTEYSGAAHGTAGIMLALLDAQALVPSALPPSHVRRVQATVEAIRALRLPTGNYPTRPDQVLLSLLAIVRRFGDRVLRARARGERASE
jgi:hypothetical protein